MSNCYSQIRNYEKLEAKGIKGNNISSKAKLWGYVELLEDRILPPPIKIRIKTLFNGLSNCDGSEGNQLEEVSRGHVNDRSW